MKRTLLSLIAIVAFSSAIFAQTGWTLVNSNLPSTSGVGQISVGMNNSNALWALNINAAGNIVDKYSKSTDGGLTWTAGTFNAGTGLSQLFAIDENTCWALFNTGASQGCYKTTNGGTTWVKKGTAFGASSFADAFHFFNDLDGFAIGDPVGGYFEIYTTSDGGETWTRVPQANIPAPSSSQEYGITGNYCGVGDHVWFGTNEGRIFHSADKGHTWTAALTAYGNAETVAPEFADALHGVAYRSYLNMGIEPTINITSDGGATWTSYDVGGTWYARWVTHIPGTVSTYVGSSSEPTMNGISYSYDGGYNWIPITEGYDFQATAWLNEATGWAGTIATAKKSTESTGGMYIYAGDSILPLAARFEADVVGIELGQSVTFTNLSTGSPTSASWTFEGGYPATFPGMIPPPVIYNAPGSYNVTLRVFNSFDSDTLTKTDYIYVGGVGINENNNVTISMYPTPVNDVLNVSSTQFIQEIQIFNMVGQVVMDKKVNNKAVTLNTSDLSTGVYTLKAKINDRYYVRKVVVN